MFVMPECFHRASIAYRFPLKSCGNDDWFFPLVCNAQHVIEAQLLFFHYQLNNRRY